jgi:Leucine-rich repeat (LRR) protein
MALPISFSLLIGLLCLQGTQAQPKTPLAQINSLQALYNSTNGENWIWKNEALSGSRWSFVSPISSSLQSDPCSTNNKAWQGISCTSTPSACKTISCSIVSISLVSYGLVGMIPSEIYQLITLTNLEMSSNGLGGSISSNVGSLVKLRQLNLQNNIMTGTLHSSISLMSRLQYFLLDVNQLSGTIPSSLSELTLLENIYLSENRFNGSIPSELSSLSRLQHFYLYGNALTGTIHSSFSLLSSLQYFVINSNQLSGQFPSLSLMSQLRYFVIGQNHFTGTIPTSLSFLTQLRQVHLYENHFTGSIPSDFSLLSYLAYLTIYNNQLTGTLPSSLSSLSRLQFLYADGNQLTGHFPSEFSALIELEIFRINMNFLTGTIPTSISSSLSKLQDFNLYGNHFIGTLPTFSLQTQLEYFIIGGNQLTGTIHLQLASFPSLIQFYISQNQFSGNLDSLFSNDTIFNFNHSKLNLFDVSGNQLTGTIPYSLFLISTLNSIALSVNCFEGELPQSICHAIEVSTFSMDGLGSARHCKKHGVIPFTDVSLGKMMEGSIPECVWKLSKLATLGLAGNGLTGTIGNDSALNRLVKLVLSHNYLSGTIPTWLLEKQTLLSLDLSHNKLTGDLDQMNKISYWNKSIERELNLGVNRLSGQTPSNVDGANIKLNILSGNLFGCQHIPADDINSEYYVCGSSEYDQSMTVLGVLIGFMILLTICLMILIIISPHTLFTNKTNSIRIWWENQRVSFPQLVKYSRYYLNETITPMTRGVEETMTRGDEETMTRGDEETMTRGDEETMTRGDEEIKRTMNQFGKSLVDLMRLFLIMTFTIVFCSIPLYILKGMDNNSFVTHSHQYRWYYSIAYFSGCLPAIFLMGFGLISMLVLLVSLSYLFKTCQNENSKSENNKRELEQQQQQQSPIHRILRREPNDENDDPVMIPTANEKMMMDKNQIFDFNCLRIFFYLSFIFLLNLLIVGNINGFYINSTTRQDLPTSSRIIIQFNLSLFIILWKLTIRSLVPNQIQNTLSEIKFISCLEMINSVLIPCLVTALTSPTCYERLLIKPDDISSVYTYTACDVWRIVIPSNRYCASYSIATTVLTLIPPFTYSYQCGSTLLVSYIPVYMYSTIFQIIIDLIRTTLIFQTNYKDYPIFIQRYFPLPHNNIITAKITTSLINNMILLLSFGLASPVLV